MIKLKRKTRTGIYLIIFLEIKPTIGNAKANASGTMIKRMGFTIFAPLSYADQVNRSVYIIVLLMKEQVPGSQLLSQWM